MTGELPDPIWIDSDSVLRQIEPLWFESDAIAIDTEFLRTDTFYARPGLIQLSDGVQVWLIDPLAIEDFSPLSRLFLCPSVIKVFHSCSEDLELLYRLVGSLPQPLFDTQIAAGFAGKGFCVGYQRLVSMLLEVDLPKDETRSDWIKRPLTSTQIHYAALDVYYLLKAFRVLYSELEVAGKLSWLLQEGETLAVNAGKNDDFDQYYRQVKVAWKLFPDQLAVLRALCEWREINARQQDIPRNRLVKEQVLWDIAKYLPTKMDQLRRINGVGNELCQRHGKHLLSLISKALQDKNTFPSRLPFPLPASCKPMVKRIRQYCSEKAEEIGVEPELLIRKKQIDALLQSGVRSVDQFCLPAILGGWRADVFATELVDVLNREFKS